MPDIVGGLRARLIRDSFQLMLRDSLSQLGWFDPDRRHAPINFTGHDIDNATEIPLNTLVLSDDNLTEVDIELGSTGIETTTTFYVDFYAEDNPLGMHMIHDVRDILGGRMASIGRNDPSCPVYDFRQATPNLLFVVGIERIVVDRAHDFPKPWQKHWYACRFDAIDSYFDDASVNRAYNQFYYGQGLY